MCLRGKMEYCIDFEPPQALYHIRPSSHITVKEVEIGMAFQHSRVMARTTVVQLVEGDNTVVIGIVGDEVSDKP